MKFQVRDLTKCTARVGLLTELPAEDTQLETPTVMLYTQVCYTNCVLKVSITFSCI